jgi:transcriptional regulator with XRE-family HTH domain
MAKASANEYVSEMARRVSELRAKLGWSLDRLAADAGMLKAHIWAIENGNQVNPTIDTVQRLSRSLGCSMAHLIGQDDEGYEQGFRDGYFRCREDMKEATMARIKTRVK